MTTTTDAPPQTRPPHIDPRWWYRATWHARQQAVDAHNKANRPHDVTLEREERAITPRALDTESLIESATLLLADGETPHSIAARLGTTVDALEQRFRRRGLKDLARPFLRARKVKNGHPCLDCGKTVSERAKRCPKCAAQEACNRPEIRELRSALARNSNNKFGKGRVA